jgi:hypothetical protein
MNNKKRQNLTICLTSKTKDFFGVWSVSILINKKEYIYNITSTFAVEEAERMLYNKRYGKAIQILKQNTIKEETKIIKGEK